MKFDCKPLRLNQLDGDVKNRIFPLIGNNFLSFIGGTVSRTARSFDEWDLYPGFNLTQVYLLLMIVIMKMKTILLAGLISVSLLNGQNKKLLFIGIDGCRPDALTQAQTPNIDGLINNGIYINDALCSINGQPTVSGPGW
ncbi:uncharacterized protein METZ01_LOCUS221358, partial [marine metagenome]